MSDNEEQQFNFKTIVALKVEGVNSLSCELKLLGRTKMTELPQSEGQFFDLQEVPQQTELEIIAYYQQRKVGQVTVLFPDTIYENEETELSDVTKMNYSDPKTKKTSTLKLKYFIIILNKKIFLERNQKSGFKNNQTTETTFFDEQQQRNQSPSTKKYLQSQHEHEDSKYNQALSKRMLQAPKLNDSLNKSDILSDQQSQTAFKQTPSRSNHNSPYAKYGGSSSPKNSKELKNKNDYLQRQINSLEVQLRSLPAEIESLRNQLAESERNRSQLHEELKKLQGVNPLKELQTGNDAKFDQDMKKIMKLENLIDDLKIQLAQKNNQIQEYKDKNALIDEFARLCKEQQSKLEDQDKKIRELSALLGKDDSKSSKQNSKQSKEKALQEQMNKLRAELLKEQQKNQQLQSSLDNALSRIQLLQNQGLANKQLSDLNDRLKGDNNDLRAQIAHLQETVDNLREQIAKLENRPTNNNTDENLKTEIGDLKRQIREKELEIGRKDHEILQLKSDLQDLKVQFDNLRAGVSGSQNKNLLIENSSLLTTVNELTRQLRNINKQLLEARLTAKDYEREVEEKEQYILNLKHLILSFQERWISVAYVPEMNDKIDKALANYLNKQEDVEILKNLFMRESEGVYQFGSKKIYVKVEQDKIKIRSGGGFMTIEEFLQMFSQVELEKNQRQDPLLSMQKNKALYKKIDDMKQVNKMRADQMSPMRKSGKL